MRRTLVATALGMLCGQSVAADAAGSHWYASLGLGWGFADDIELSGLDADAGFDFGRRELAVAFGRSFGERWRLELEAAEHANDFEVVQFPATGAAFDPAPEDALAADSLLVNVIREFRIGTALRPHLGIGVGVADVALELHQARIHGEYVTDEYPEVVDDTTTTLAYQIIAGLDIPLGSRFDLGVDYRYWHAPDFELEDVAGTPLDLDHTVHSGSLSLRYRFSPRVGSAAAPDPSPMRGWYFAGTAGGAYAMDAEIQGSVANYDAFDVGPLLSFSAGYAWRDTWRAELELSRRHNDVDIVDLNPELGERVASGDVRADSLMANVVYTFRPAASVRPYVGLGAGIVNARYDVDTAEGPFVDDDARGAAFQLLLGFDIAISPVLWLSADYRPWITSSMEMRLEDGTDAESFHLVNSLGLTLRFAPRAR